MLSSVRKPTPLVTGISPKEGPPGTRVTIRGENLGINTQDVIGVRICGVDCLLSAEWKSQNKIMARTASQVTGKGDIIITTRSGGVGSSTVFFKGYHVQTGLLQESAVWVDESQSWTNLISRNRVHAHMMSSEHDDPLGISDESDAKFKGDLVEMFPEGSGNTSDEQFVPAWFLLENHHGTSFDDLKAGLAFLKRKSSQRNEGPLAFVKANLTTFMDCQDTLADMHDQLMADQKASPDGDVTKPLEEVLHKANESADVLFQDVLGRKDRADATRNALGVLHRFKFLFNLPCSIDRNVRKGDYDLVITDYTRARSLFGDTDVQVFKKVYLEVETRIAAFREMLLKKLLHLPSTPEEQKRLIRYLFHLETPGDPAWQCLVNMQKWLLNLLISCKDQHIAKDHESEKKEDISTGSPSHSLHTTQLSREPSFRSPREGTRVPQRVTFVEDLSKILTEYFPDLWRLGQTYFTGKLIKEAKDKPTRVDPTKHAQFKKMIVEVINLYSNLIRAAFLPQSLENFRKSDREKFGNWRENKSDSPIAWLPICVRCVRSCVAFMSTLDLTSDSMELLQDLAFDMRTNCMTTLLTQAIDDIKSLHQRETWDVEVDDERGGTTLLPALFENLVFETVHHLQEIIQTRQGENEIFSQRPIQKEASQLCIALLQSFAGTLEQLAMVGNVERQTVRDVDSTSSRSAMRPDMFSPGESNKMPSLEKRLMIMLSNCQHTKEHILPRLIEHLNKHGYPETNKVLQASEHTYKQLDEKLFEQYIEEKSNPIVGAMEQNMYRGKFDWNTHPHCTGVRRYLKLALMGIIEVHAEVYAISPHLVGRVMTRVIECVVEELARLVLCVTKFSQHGTLQARLELFGMEIAVNAYKSDNTISAIGEALEVLPDIQGQDEKKRLEELLNQFQSQMKFQLMCFQPDHTQRAYMNGN